MDFGTNYVKSGWRTTWVGCMPNPDSKDSRGRQVARGVYFYRLDTKGFRDVKKAVVTRQRSWGQSPCGDSPLRS